MLKLIAIALVSYSMGVSADKARNSDELTAALEKIRVEHEIPAMAVAVITSGEVSYARGFGYLDKRQANPVKKESLFRVASISKLFTAQAVMQLAQENKLGLDDRVDTYLPVFEGRPFTIKQLLTHSSGLTDSVKPESFEENRSVSSYLESVNKSIPGKLKQDQFEYSDTNYNVLGAVISAISGQEFERYIHDNILIPSGMQHSNYFDAKKTYFSEAKPTHKGKLISKRKQRPYDVAFNPSEGLISNVHELGLWLKLTLDHDNTILNETSFKAMLEPQVKTTWGEIHMGLGWQVYLQGHEKVARHPGGIRGYKSLVLGYPDKRNAIILLSNSSDTPRWDIAKTITAILKSNSEW